MARYYDIMQRSHRQLASSTGTGMLNVGEIWERLLGEHPAFSLYEDGNHPTVHGSYLAALVIYAGLCGDACGEVSYVPAGISDADAEQIKDVVRRYTRQRL